MLRSGEKTLDAIEAGAQALQRVRVRASGFVEPQDAAALEILAVVGALPALEPAAGGQGTQRDVEVADAGASLLHQCGRRGAAR